MSATKVQQRLKFASNVIFAVGFGIAMAIYLLAGTPPASPLGYDDSDTKRYLYDLQRYGGTANVVADQFRQWFIGLWYGKTLGVTLAAITVILFLTVRFIATPATSAARDAHESPGQRRGGN